MGRIVKEHLESTVLNKLNSVSPSFCLAKWTGVTLHLESGTTHSCHHPPVHKIPIEEIKENPSAIHNTQHKIQQRKKMIEGERPEECDYCWKIEDLKTNEISDRLIKSGAEWSLPHIEEILFNPYNEKYKPKYLEVSFSTKCQFKCSYCSANSSSSWEEEIKKHGDYVTGAGRKLVDILIEEENPYIEAFWKWWPEVKNSLNTFRITGGEPLLSPSTFKIMESLVAEPQPQMNLAINSNMSVPPVLLQKFFNLVSQISSTNATKTFELYTSIDTFGQQADYIRTGMKSDTFWQNVENYLSINDKIKVSIMCTFNALSIFSFTQLLDKITELNLKYRTENRKLPIYLDISFLRQPDYQAVQVLPENFHSKMEDIVKYIEENQWFKTEHKAGFHEDQIIKSKRILEWMRQGVDPQKKSKLQRDFYRYYSQHDERRETSILDVFPEIHEFWNICKIEHEKDNELNVKTEEYNSSLNDKKIEK